jgi:PBP1b-binding outer membrane lipoprotein LpoB
MKKVVIVLLLFLIVISGCSKATESNLNELQKQACNTASKYNTCDKLQDIDIVTKEKCCKELSKCC